MEERETILSVRDLNIKFSLRGRTLHAIRDVSLDLYKGESLAIVGESGSGKSVFVKSFMGLLDANGWVDSGEILYNGEDLTKFTTEKQWLRVRGKQIAMVLQDPMTSLNPLKTIGAQIMEAIKLHQNLHGEAARKEMLSVLTDVGITEPERRAKQYPHEFSGGMRQRVVIAIAVACRPQILICDEPTTALDVTIQAQILDLMNELRESYDTSVIMITHDLGVIAETCEQVAVFYAGQVVEQADVNTLFHAPAHPYTKGLLRSVTSLGGAQRELYTIRGTVPTAGHFSSGCRFADRCDACMEKCRKSIPPLCEIESGHLCRCFLHDGAKGEVQP